MVLSKDREIVKRTLSLIKIVALVLISLLTTNVYGHHGHTSQFDQSRRVSVSGVITEIKMVNPHAYVYFDVINEQGGTDNWRCELQAGSIHKRAGWTEEMFKPGTKVDIVGAPMWREETGCYLRTISFNGGPAIGRRSVLSREESDRLARQATLNDGVPNLNGNWVSPWQNSDALRGSARRFSLTDAGTKETKGFVIEDSPRFNCKAVNVFQDWTFDQHVNKIEQNTDVITMTYGFMDIVRTIHLNLQEQPENIVPSRAGHSIGYWEGQTLVVDSKGFTEGYLDARHGIKHSNQLHTVEYFTLENDGRSLRRRYIASDPLFLSKPYESEDRMMLTNAAFDPYECNDLTQERVDGI